MTGRKIVFATNEIYHVFNRGIEKRDIFLNFKEYSNFLSTLRHYLFYPHRTFSKTQIALEDGSLKEEQLISEKTENPSVEILNLCLMPNHFHFTMRQKTDRGVSNFMQKVCTSYSKYFNKKYERDGRLFETRFKAVRVKSEEQLIHLSRYIHLNPIKDLKGKKNVLYAIHYKWSSLNFYLGKEDNPINEICKKDDILGSFSSIERYKSFIISEVVDQDKDVLESVSIDDDFAWYIEK